MAESKVVFVVKTKINGNVGHCWLALVPTSIFQHTAVYYEPTTHSPLISTNG